MYKEKLNSPFKIIILDGVTYKEDDIKNPFSGIYYWKAADGSDVESIYEKGKCIHQKVIEDNILRSETLFKEGGVKEIIIYESDGQIKTKSCLLDGKLEGLFELYSDGRLYMTTEFRQGRKSGECLVYSADGSVSHRESFINDVKQK